MRFRVLKFGGTSVGTPVALLSACAIVDRAVAESHAVVVISALSGVTSELARQVAAALGRDPSWRASLRRLRERHRDLLLEVSRARSAASSVGASASASAGGAAAAGYREAAQAMDRGLEGLRDRLRAMEVLGAVSPRARAWVMAAGERLASSIFAAALLASGHSAETVDGTEVLVADGPHDDAFPDVAASRPKVAACISRLRGAVPVITGFFGGDAAGGVRLFGRGGSDTSATALGAALAAERVEIWTDVDGVSTADPRVDPAAERLPRLSYEEAERLAQAGAKVLHWKAIGPAREAGVPILVRDTFRPQLGGTWIGFAEREVELPLVC